LANHFTSHTLRRAVKLAYPGLVGSTCCNVLIAQVGTVEPIFTLAQGMKEYLVVSNVKIPDWT